MNRAIHATYDGSVLRPHKPLALTPNSTVRILVLPAPSKKAKPYSFFEFAKSANIEGPKDWSSHLHDYLYHPKSKAP